MHLVFEFCWAEFFDFGCGCVVRQKHRSHHVGSTLGVVIVL